MKDFEDLDDIVEGEVSDDAFGEEFEDSLEDEFEDAILVEETAVAKQTKATPALLDFDSIDLGLSIPGVIVAETGTKVSRFPVERIRFTTSKRERISIITDKVIIVKTHFIEDFGSIICNGSACCEHIGLPSVRYLFPIVHYEDTDKKGKPLSADVSVKVLTLGKDNYEDLLTIADNKGSLTQFDLVVTCTDEQYQKCSYTEAGAALWKKSKKLLNDVAEVLKKDGKNLVLPLGRTMTDAQLNRVLGMDTPPGLPADVDLDDVFNDD
jgi:hypothetical protein